MLRAEGKSPEEISRIVANRIGSLGINPNQAAGNTPWRSMMESIQNFVTGGIVEGGTNPPRVGPLSPQGGTATHFATVLDAMGAHFDANFNSDGTGQPNVGLTNMTLRDAVSMGSSNLGRYLLTPGEVREAARELGLPLNTTRFTPQVQGQLVTHFLNQAGLSTYLQNPTPEARAAFISTAGRRWGLEEGRIGPILDQLVQQYSARR
jgi:hypothetical protein